MMKDKKTKHFTAIYNEHFNLIFIIAQRYANYNEACSYDIVQTVFMKAYDSIESLRDQTKIKSWLIAIAHNEGKTYLRKKITEREALKEYGEELELDDEPKLEDKELKEKIKHYVATIEDLSLKKIIERFYYDTKKVREISDELGIPVSTITTKLNRFRVKLMKDLAQDLLLQGDKKS